MCTNRGGSMSKPLPMLGVLTFSSSTGWSSKSLPRALSRKRCSASHTATSAGSGFASFSFSASICCCELGFFAGLQDGFRFVDGPRVDAGVAVEADVAERVEVREDLVVVALRDRIELVVVALGAAEREAEHRFAERFHAVDVVVGEILLGDRAALVRVHVVALEAGGDELGFGAVRQQVAGELVAEELVVRQVAC